MRAEILDEKINNGETVEVLFESMEGGYAFGHTADFIEVKVKCEMNMHEQFKNVKLLSHDGNVCTGVIV